MKHRENHSVIYGGIDCDSTQISLVLLGDIEPKPWYLQVKGNKREKDWQKRIFDMSKNFMGVMREESRCRNISLIAVESPVMIQNPKTTIILSEVDSLVCKVLYNLGVPYIGVSNLIWKKHIIGSGRAKKSEIREYALSRYGSNWGALLNQHACDSIGIAEYAGILLKNENDS